MFFLNLFWYVFGLFLSFIWGYKQLKWQTVNNNTDHKQHVLNCGGIACIDMLTWADYTKICSTSFHTPSHMFCHSCLHPNPHTPTQTHTIYWRVTLFFFFCRISHQVSPKIWHLDHLDRGVKLSAPSVVVYLDRHRAVSTNWRHQQLHLYYRRTNTYRKSSISSSHLNLTLTSPPLTAASSIQDFTPPTWFIWSHPFGYSFSPSLSSSLLPSLFSPAEQGTADLSDQRS